MKLSRKKRQEISRVSFALQTFEQVCPKENGNFSWWETPPEMWSDGQRELWDLVLENEDRVKAAILEILDPRSDK